MLYVYCMQRIQHIFNKHAINFSALRKAFESDDMSFAIIQQMYKTVLKIFNLVYSDLIKNDYHSKIWCEDMRIILKKSDKSNYSISKIYRIITLLNCLDKVAEKIIASNCLTQLKLMISCWILIKWETENKDQL